MILNGVEVNSIRLIERIVCSSGKFEQCWWLGCQ